MDKLHPKDNALHTPTGQPLRVLSGISATPQDKIAAILYQVQNDPSYNDFYKKGAQSLTAFASELRSFFVNFCLETERVLKSL